MLSPRSEKSQSPYDAKMVKTTKIPGTADTEFDKKEKTPSPISRSAIQSPIATKKEGPESPYIDGGDVVIPRHFIFYGNAVVLLGPTTDTVMQATVALWQEKWNAFATFVTIGGRQYRLRFEFSSETVTYPRAKQLLSSNVNAKDASVNEDFKFHPNYSFIRVEDIDESAHNSTFGENLTDAFDGTREDDHALLGADNSIFLPSHLLNTSTAYHELIHQFLSRDGNSHVSGWVGNPGANHSDPKVGDYRLSIRTIRWTETATTIPNSIKIGDGSGNYYVYGTRVGGPAPIALEKPASNATNSEGATYTRIDDDGVLQENISLAALLAAEKRINNNYKLYYQLDMQLREVLPEDKQAIIDRYFKNGQLPSMVGGATNTYFEASGTERSFDYINNAWR